MEFVKLKRLLAESEVYRRFEEMIAFITYREVRELRFERVETRSVARPPER